MGKGSADIIERGRNTRFTSTRQPKGVGRKPKLYTLAKQGYNIGVEEFREVVTYLLQLNKNQLEEVIDSNDTPMWVTNIARALHKDTGRGVMFALSECLEYTFGRSLRAGKEKGQGAVDLSLLSDSELETYYTLYRKATGGADSE